MKPSKGIGGHHHAVMKSDEWLTPPEIIQALGTFDLDPCAPVHRPWPTAARHFTILDDGLYQVWQGRVWLNPPYGSRIKAWMAKMATHNDGIALTFARTDTDMFHRYVFPMATSLFFFKTRVHFYTVAGTRAKSDGGAPSVLIAYGAANSERICEAGLSGRHVSLGTQLVIVGISPTWRSVITIAFTRLNNQASLQQLYDTVEIIAPDKTAANGFFKEKIRQTVNKYFSRIDKGIYSYSKTTIEV